MKSAPRVVLDTNVVLSALLFAGSRLVWLRQAWQTGRLQPLASKPTTTELVRALAYPKFSLSSNEQRELLADYLPMCVALTVPPDVPRTPPCRDPHDLPFLQLAVVGKAHYVVTGDKDLLELAGHAPFPIVTPERLRDEIGPT